MTRKKICPFFSLIFMMSCGKKMTEPESVTKPQIQNQLPSSTLILAIEKRFTKFSSIHNGQYTLPDQLRVRSNNALGKVVTIIYNIRAEDNETYDAKCIYKGTAENFMPVEKCVDQDGFDLGDITQGENQMIIPAGNSIQLESNSDDLKADAIYDVNWI